MDNARTYILGRMFIIFGLVMILPVAIILQLLRIQVLEGDNLRELWNRQAIDFISIPAERGAIKDRHGRVLATNQVTYRIAVDPHAPGITRDDLRDIAAILGNHSQNDAAYYLNRVDQASPGSRYVVLARRVGFDAHQELNMLESPGLIIEEQYRRQYSYESLAAHVLGFMNYEYQGMSGLEASYNHYLKGEDGLQQVRRDRTNQIREVVGAPRKQPKQGNNIVTTIDADIQAIVEEELEKGIEQTSSKRGVAIVMNPKTGEVKAMANYPTFDPNRPASSPGENRRNFAVSDEIEPGSTYKLVTSVAAWEEGVVGFDEVFETPESGVKLIHGQTMRDHDPLGSLTFPEVIQKSSNIATSEIAMRLEPDVLYQYSRNLGFGTRTNVGLPNEETGNLRRPYQWSQVTRPWLSIGYEVQVTPIQLIQAYGAFANDGVMMRPYIVDRILDERGEVIDRNRPKKIRQAIRPETVEKLRPVFEGVVSDSGTAEYASVEYLNVAGKTGTAQKFEDGSYQARYRASFVGFFPSEDARYVTLILLDEPQLSFYGGFTAGPIFSRIAERLIGLDKDWNPGPEPDYEPSERFVPKLAGMPSGEASEILQRLNVNYSIEGNGRWVAGQIPEPGETIRPGQSIVVRLAGIDAEPDEKVGRVPDVTGMSMRRAIHLLRKSGYDVQVIGSGTVGSQYPEKSTPYSRGRTVTIRGRTAELTGLIETGS